MLETEIDKIFNPGDYPVATTNASPTERPIEELTLQEIQEIYPDVARELKGGVFAKATNPNGQFSCAICAGSSPTKALFEIDHIVPMSKGGLTTSGNLQLLCRNCNRRKSDK